MADEIKIISRVVPRRRDGAVLPGKSIIQQTGGAPAEHTHPYLPAMINEDGSYTVDISKVLFKGSIIAEQEVSAYGAGGSGGTGGSFTIVDNLLSSSTDAALSANQGRVLKGMIDEIRKESVVTELAKLKDVMLGVPADGDTLKYDAAQGKWVNSKSASGNWKDLQGKPEGLTDENIAKWVKDSHQHVNLKVLDTITAEKVSSWDKVAADWAKVFYFDEQGNLHAKVNLIGDLEVSAYGKGSSTGGSGSVTIVDNLLSTSTDAALSANQGRVLKGLIDEIRQQGTGGGVSSWNDLKDKPSWIGATKPSYSWGEITGKPASFVPSEHDHYKILNSGDTAAVSNATTIPSGFSIHRIYMNGYPCNYGNLLRIGGAGSGELACEWRGGEGGYGRLFYRSKRDNAGTYWTDWRQVAYTSDTVENANKLGGLSLEQLRRDGYIMHGYSIDASNLDQNTWYPVTIQLSTSRTTRIEIRNALDGGTPSWSTHSAGFSVNKIWEVNGEGWGTTPINRRILVSTYQYAQFDPVTQIGQLNFSSKEYVYVRGGGRYHFYTSNNAQPVLRTSTYTENGQSISPTTGSRTPIKRNVVMQGDRLKTYEITHNENDNWTDSQGVSHPWYGLKYYGYGSNNVNSCTLSSYWGMTLKTSDSSFIALMTSRVGIGVTNPQAALEVDGSILCSYGLVVKNTNDILRYRGYPNERVLYWHWTNQYGDYLQFTIPGNNNQQRNFILSETQGFIMNGNLKATGEITAYSDIRLKSDIKPLANRGAVTPITYTKDGKESIGFSAQEVRELYPELVHEDAGEKHYLSVNYSQYVAVLQAQVIELQQQIDELKKK